MKGEPVSRLPQDDDAGVSIRPSDMHPGSLDGSDAAGCNREEPPTLADISRFHWKLGKEDDRLNLLLSPFEHRALEALEATIRREGLRVTLGQVALFGLSWGVERMRGLDDLQTVSACHRAILASGHDAIEQLKWAYRFGHGTPERISLRFVDPWLRDTCSQHAANVGLPPSTVHGVAIALGVVDAPWPSDDIPRALSRELQEFARRLKERAILMQQLRAVATNGNRQTPRPRLGWREALRHE